MSSVDELEYNLFGLIKKAYRTENYLQVSPFIFQDWKLLDDPDVKPTELRYMRSLVEGGLLQRFGIAWTVIEEEVDRTCDDCALIFKGYLDPERETLQPLLSSMGFSHDKFGLDEFVTTLNQVPGVYAVEHGGYMSEQEFDELSNLVFPKGKFEIFSRLAPSRLPQISFRLNYNIMYQEYLQNKDLMPPSFLAHKIAQWYDPELNSRIIRPVDKNVAERLRDISNKI